nr:hypothetical protein GCM10020093_072750 [Planobispora longispora]
MTLPTQNRPFVGGFALVPSLRAPTLPTHSPRSSCTRTCIPRKPASTNARMASRSSGRSCPAAACGGVAPSAAAAPGAATPASSAAASAAVTPARRKPRGVRALLTPDRPSRPMPSSMFSSSYAFRSPEAATAESFMAATIADRSDTGPSPC